MSRFCPLLSLTAIFAALVLFIGDLEARPSSGGSFGSRGSRTFSAPPSTTTAPRGGSTFDRTMTQPSRPGAVANSPARPGQQPGGLFNRPGLMGGLLAGFLGAGLLGMLFGNGLLGGLGGMASMIGLLLQVGLVVIVGMLIWKWWQRRNAPATAAGPSLRDMGDYSGSGNSGGNQPYGAGGAQQTRGGFLGGLGGGLGGLGGGLGGGQAAAAQDSNIELEKEDFDEFERLLSEVSLAFADEDYTKLRPLVTPEMLSYFSEDLAKNASRGVANKVSDIKLLQGDLAEAWREGDTEYATVAMRYQIRDITVDRTNGQVVEGSPEPQEVTELWSFRRERGGRWVLSAIQQA
jgi:predicted lipid-binding transport protein (Tim44 family)